MIDKQKEGMLYYRFLTYLESEDFEIEYNMVFDEKHICIDFLGTVFNSWLDEQSK